MALEFMNMTPLHEPSARTCTPTITTIHYIKPKPSPPNSLPTPHLNKEWVAPIEVLVEGRGSYVRVPKGVGFPYLQLLHTPGTLSESKGGHDVTWSGQDKLNILVLKYELVGHVKYRLSQGRINASNGACREDIEWRGCNCSVGHHHARKRGFRVVEYSSRSGKQVLWNLPSFNAHGGYCDMGAEIGFQGDLYRKLGEIRHIK